jgi:carboxyl-terminal processing protease
MNQPTSAWNRRTARFAWLALAFAAGLLVERSGRLLTPYYYTPSGLERTFAPFWETWDLVQSRYVDRGVVAPQRLTRAAIAGMLASLGDIDHTAYLSPEELHQMESVLQGHMEGIGVRMAFRETRPTVVVTMPGSPAEKAGVKAGDIFLKVDDQSVRNMSLDQISALVRGPVGSTVKLQLSRAGKAQPLEFTLTRERVVLADVTWHMLPGTAIGHVAIHSFGEQAHDQLKSALSELRGQGVKALLLDVRGDQGGIKDQAIAIASEFLASGAVLIEQSADGQQTPALVTPGGSELAIPLCILIDRGSASASEILAGAIQDHHRGELIGTKTFGAGTVLGLFNLSDGSAVKLAIREWLTPDGRRIWHKGVAPDIDVPLNDPTSILMPEMEKDLTPEQLAKCADRQVQKGVEVLEKALKEPAAPASH